MKGAYYMGMTDDIRAQADVIKKKDNSEVKLRASFNNVALKLIDTFVNDANSGAIRLDSVTDLSRLFQIYTDVNNLNSGIEGGTGTLPALPPSQHALITDKLPVNIEQLNGEDVEKVSLSDVAGLSEADITELMLAKEQLMNQENEGKLV